MIKILSWVARSSLAGFLLMLLINTIRVEEKTLNQHFLGVMGWVQNTVAVERTNRALSVWVDQIQSHRSAPKSQSPSQPSKRQSRELERLIQRSD